MLDEIRKIVLRVLVEMIVKELAEKGPNESDRVEIERIAREMNDPTA